LYVLDGSRLLAAEYWETPWFGDYTKIMSVFTLLALPHLRGCVWRGRYNKKISEMLLILFQT